MCEACGCDFYLGGVGARLAGAVWSLWVGVAGGRGCVFYLKNGVAGGRGCVFGCFWVGLGLGVW